MGEYYNTLRMRTAPHFIMENTPKIQKKLLVGQCLVSSELQLS